MAAASGLRIGDADREAAAASLREHFAQGRLTLEEFQHRLGAVFSARTERDLADITRDLPHASVPPASLPAGRPAAGDKDRRPGHRSRFAALAGLVLIMLAILVVGALLPVALFGMAISRSIFFVLGLLLFGRRGAAPPVQALAARRPLAVLIQAR